MTRELDLEIARLDGQEFEPVKSLLDPERVFYPLSLPNYSTSLDTLMELIRRRWPDAEVFLEWNVATLGVPIDANHAEWECIREGDTDAERLARAVKQALEAEA